MLLELEIGSWELRGLMVGPESNFLSRSYTEFILASEVRMTARSWHIASLLNRARELERAE